MSPIVLTTILFLAAFTVAFALAEWLLHRRRARFGREHPLSPGLPSAMDNPGQALVPGPDPEGPRHNP